MSDSKDTRRKTLVHEPVTKTPEAAPLTPQHTPDAEITAPQNGLFHLQRTIGNRATQAMLQGSTVQRRIEAAKIQRDAHAKGCSCASCSRLSLKRNLIQRVDEHEEDIQAKRDLIQRVDEHEEDIQAMRLIQRAGEKKTSKQKVEEATLATVDDIKALLATDHKKIMLNNSAMKLLASKVSVKDFMAAVKDIEGITLKKELKAAFKYWSNVTLSDIQPNIEAASQDERTLAWKSSLLLKAAKKNMGTDPYLDMLPLLGMFKKGVTAEDKKSHTRADKADQHIRKYLSAYVGDAVKAGKKVEGQVAVVDGKDWKDAYDREFGNDGLEDSTNAFVDKKGLIWVHKRRGNAGTIIHEGVHKYATDDFLSEVGFNFNEGITEYFTRKITKELKYDRGNYQNNFEFSEKFATYVGEAKLAKGYFDGSWVPVKDEFESKSKKSWADLKAKVKSEDWGAAEGMLK